MRTALLALSLAWVAASPFALAQEDPPEPPSDAPAPETPPEEPAEPPEPPPPGAPSAATPPDEPPAQEPPPFEPPAAPSEPEAPPPTAVADEDGPSEAEVAAWVAWFRPFLQRKKAQVLERMEEKMLDGAAERMAIIATVMGGFGLCGVLLLLLPLKLGKQMPEQRGLLWKYSALAAVTFMFAVWLFTGSLLLLQLANASLGSITNPQLAIVEASFDTLDENAEELTLIGPQFVQGPLAQLDASGDDDEMPLLAILDNASKVRGELQVFASIAKLLRGLSGVMAWVPLLLTLLGIALFLRTIKDVLREIVSMPARAAESGDAGSVLAKVGKAVGGELVATLLLIGIVFGVALGAGTALSVLVRPGVDALFGHLILSLLYISSETAASTLAIYASLGGAVLFLGLNLGVVLITCGTTVGKCQLLLRARFRDGVPFGEHGRFWGWGALGWLWCLILPVIFIALAEPAIDAITDALTSGRDSPWVLMLTLGPALLFVGFVATFWLGQALRGLRFIAGYKLAPAEPAPAATAIEPAQPAKKKETAQRKRPAASPEEEEAPKPEAKPKKRPSRDGPVEGPKAEARPKKRPSGEGPVEEEAAPAPKAETRPKKRPSREGRVEEEPPAAAKPETAKKKRPAREGRVEEEPPAAAKPETAKKKRPRPPAEEAEA